MTANIDYFTGALRYLYPEFCVLAAIIGAILWNLFFPRRKSLTPWLCIGSLTAACYFFVQQWELGTQPLFRLGQSYMFVVDKLTVGFGLLVAIVGIIVVFMTAGYERHFGNNRGEFYALLLAAVLSVMVLAGTTDLVLLFVSLETLTLSCVLLAGFAKRDQRSNEASLKYLLSTAATTATLLYGISFIYGLTQSTGYADIARASFSIAQSPSLMFILVIVLLLSAVGFKLSLVPFHMWAPDVYEGAPTPVTAFLSVGAKLGGIVIAIRLLVVVFAAAHANWTLVVGALAILSMFAGNIIALAQKSVKRMLAYSSIAHVGYLLIGLASNSQEGLSSMLFYLIVYGFMNLGAFAGVMLFSNETGSDKIDDFAGLIVRRPILAVALSVCLLNLAGLPVPPAGFLAKVFVFWSGFQMYSTLGYMMVAAALITSVPAIFYYSRVIIKMVVAPPSEAVQAMPARTPVLVDPQFGLRLALAACVVGIVFSSVVVNPLMDFSGQAVGCLTNNPYVGAVPGTTP